MKMLEYSKVILQKVSFAPDIFSKELKKSIHYLMPAEIKDLAEWLQENFSDRSELLGMIEEVIKNI